MNRRAALRRLALPAGAALPRLAPLGAALLSPPAPAQPAAAQPGLADLQALTLLERLTWGPTADALQRCRALGPQAWLGHQLDGAVGALPAAVQEQIDGLSIVRQPLPQRLAAVESLRQRSLKAGSEAERVDARQAFQQEMTRQEREAAARHLLRAVHSPAQLRELMQWFWLNHFNVFARKGPLRVLLGDYEEQAIRPHALGDFRALLGAVTRHPAMLLYLDNRQNAAGRGNENHARELLELHTLGVDGGYTQQDVQALARVLTGHGVRLDGADSPVGRRGAALRSADGTYVFAPARHDDGDKTVLGQRIRAQGAEELDEVLDLLARHPATAVHVTGKMARFFLGHEAPPELATAMARAFQGGRIRDALEVLASSPVLLDTRRPAFKDPMHYVLSSVRLLAGDRPVLNTLPMQNWLTQLGQALYHRQTPDGYPDTAEAWNASGQMTARFDLARVFAAGAPLLFMPPGSAPGGGAAARASVPPPLSETLASRFSPGTREALARATTAAEWTALFFSAPEYMHR